MRQVYDARRRAPTTTQNTFSPLPPVFDPEAQTRRAEGPGVRAECGAQLSLTNAPATSLNLCDCKLEFEDHAS
jgi:hypothetical protein